MSESKGYCRESSDVDFRGDDGGVRSPVLLFSDCLSKVAVNVVGESVELVRGGVGGPSKSRLASIICLSG